MSSSIERERKFLLRSTEFLDGYPSVWIVQGYVVVSPDVELRIRVTDGGQVLTVKGMRSGIERHEQELILTNRNEANALLEASNGRVVAKERYAVDIEAPDGFIDHWTVDRYKGDNEGLFIAEYEYPPVVKGTRRVPLPSWVGEEVTDQSRYYAANLSVHPFKEWGR